MQGRRLPDTENGDLPKMEPGDYIYDKKNGIWLAVTPDGKDFYMNKNHTFKVEEDGSLTVSPSILVKRYASSPGKPEWHGYLERGVWWEV